MEVKSYSTDKRVKGWQDTVMKPEEMLTFIPPLSDVYEAGKMCERQTEITWDIASKAGERKVVEAVERLHLVRPEREDKWQEFLKSLYGRIM